jgi:hypothetical protein
VKVYTLSFCSFTFLELVKNVKTKKKKKSQRPPICQFTVCCSFYFIALTSFFGLFVLVLLFELTSSHYKVKNNIIKITLYKFI